jgi:ABC-type polysaccharide/polyol phosphate export permease
VLSRFIRRREDLAALAASQLTFMEKPRTSEHRIYDSSRPRLAIIEEATELFRYRDLLWSLVHRDLTVRYKRSTLGFLWTMLNPLLMMLALTIVFSSLFRFAIAEYPVYLLSGMLLYNFIQWGTSQAIQNLVWGGGLMNKIYLPKTVFVVCASFVSLVNLLLALIPLAVIMILNGSKFCLALLFLPVAIALTFIFALGLALFVSTLAVFFSDVADIHSIALSIIYFLTPVFYPVSVIPNEYLGFLRLNPIYYFLEIFRQPIHQGILPDGGLVLRAFLIAVGVFLAGWWLFTKKRDEFAYRV